MVIDAQTDDLDAMGLFMLEAGQRLERALVARFGIDNGLEAAAEAIEYGLTNWEKLQTMHNPVGYLYRVGESRGRRLVQRWARLEALVVDPVTVDAVVDIDLQRALGRLKPIERVSIVLVHAHGHSYREAAEVLDLSATTITNHLHRGMVRLRRILEHR